MFRLFSLSSRISWIVDNKSVDAMPLGSSAFIQQPADRQADRLTKHAMDCEIGGINTDRWWNVDLKTTSCLPVALQFIFRAPFILRCSSIIQAYTAQTHTHCIRSGILACVFRLLFTLKFQYFNCTIQEKEKRMNWMQPTQFIGVFLLRCP